MKREELEKVVEILNGSGLLKTPVNYKSVKKQTVLEEMFLDAVDTIPRSKESEIPQSVILTYNTLVDQGPPVPAEPTEPKVEVQKEDKSKEVKPKEGTSFDSLKEKINSNKDKKFTALMDSLFLKPTTLEEVYSIVKEKAEKQGMKTFSTIGSVRQHFNFRKKQGWIFTEEGGKICLTGVK